MANWLRTLDIAHDWNEVDDDETKIVGLCEVIVSKLTNMREFADAGIEDEKVNLIHQFEEMIDTNCQDFREFNYTWQELYDWANQSTREYGKPGKVCWVKIT